MQHPSNVFRVLAIDDDDDDQILFQHWLRRTVDAPAVQLMSSAVDAVKHLETLAGNSAELPHVIFCDVKMPGLDGFGFLEWLRNSAFKHIPVVMRSASPMEADIARAYELGANSYVVKRVGLRANEERFSEVVRYWRDLAAVPGR